MQEMLLKKLWCGRLGMGNLCSSGKIIKWLLDKICRTVIAPPPSLPPDAKVSSLIDAESATWKVDQV